MLIPKCPQIIDLKTKRSLKDYVEAQMHRFMFEPTGSVIRPEN